MLADKIFEIAKGTQEDSRYYPRPSMAGSQRCQRQMVYHANGTKGKALSGRAMITFDDSTWHEELTMDWFRGTDLAPHSEQKAITIKNLFPWEKEGTHKCRICEEEISHRDCHGHIDWLVTVNGEDCLVEHKALSHFGFGDLKKGTLPDDYLTQMALYMKGLGVRRGFLLVKNKNQSAYIEIEVLYDHEADMLEVVSRIDHSGYMEMIRKPIQGIVEFAVNKFHEVDIYKNAKDYPERQYSLDHWRCKYCPYSEKCWEDWANEHEELQTEADLPNEIADTVRYYRELGGHETGIKNERAELQAQIKEVMTKSEIREGVAGEYIVKWKVTNKNGEPSSRFTVTKYKK